MYTKNGKPLQVDGDMVYSRSGAVVGRISGDKVHGPDGGYVGTIDGDRLVYRSTDSAETRPIFSAGNRGGTAAASTVSSAILGEEPKIPD